MHIYKELLHRTKHLDIAQPGFFLQFPLERRKKKEQPKADINFHWLVFLLSVKNKRVGCPLSSLHGSPTPDLGTSHE